jgi:hypothetical protein
MVVFGDPMDDVVEMNVKTISLERIFHCAMKRVNKHWLAHLKVDAQTRFIGDTVDDLVLTLETEVLAEKKVDEEYIVTFRTPATWWQMFKAQHFPEWMRLRWPIKWATEKRTVHFKKHLCYPDMPAMHVHGKEVIPWRIIEKDTVREE